MNAIKLISAILGICLFFGNSASGQNKDTTNLEALLIVGHLEDGTSSAMKRMDVIANLFIENGVKVHKFYDDEANWDEITKVSENCNFLVYRGHGSNLGTNGNAGGICINSMVSTFKLMQELKLKDNALVLFKSVCNGAGSSADDDEDIGIVEAKNRVTHYAYPFFEIGASAYYANNYVAGTYRFLKDFFSGIPLKEAYLNSTKHFTTVEFEEVFSRDETKFISIASTPGGGTAIRTSYTNGVKKVESIKSPKGYKIAYVGAADFSIKDMK